MNMYIKYDKVWAGYIDIPTIKRHLHVIFPNRVDLPILCVVKAPKTNSLIYMLLRLKDAELLL
jgi:hypothetical protein